MIFKSDFVSAQWDTWVYWQAGTFYLYYLITEHSPGEGFGVATSTDGVRWRDHGWAIRASEKMVVFLGTGAVWKDVAFEQTGRFLCNYSEWRLDAADKPTQNILFAWSHDLVHWEKFGDEWTFPVDTHRYKQYGRWDCIFPMPRDEGGYWGTWTATPLGSPDLGGRIGVGWSEDGLRWHALPPPQVVPEANESGAFWRFGDSVHAMFGRRGDMVSYVANDPRGPYRESPQNSMLTHRNHSYFARFFAGPDGLLVNHHAMTGTKNDKGRAITYAALFKRAIVDAAGTLRLRYWEGNERLKGVSVPVHQPLEWQRGAVIEGELTPPAVITVHADESRFPIQVGHDGRVTMGDPVDRERMFSPRPRFRLLARRGMLEFYLEDEFIECWALACPDATQLRIHQAASVSFQGAWLMSA